MQQPVDHGNVNPATSAIQSEFFDDQSIGIRNVIADHALHHRCTHISIAGGHSFFPCEAGTERALEYSLGIIDGTGASFLIVPYSWTARSTDAGRSRIELGFPVSTPMASATARL